MTRKYQGSSHRTDPFSEVLNGKRPAADERFLSDVLGPHLEQTTDRPTESLPQTHTTTAHGLPAGSAAVASPTSRPDPVIISAALTRSLTGSAVRDGAAGKPWTSTDRQDGAL